MLRFLFGLAFLVASCVSDPPPEPQISTDNIARSCEILWEADSSLGFRRICACTAQSVQDNWSTQRLAEFDRRYARYVQAVDQFRREVVAERFRRCSVENAPNCSVESIFEGHPQIPEELREDIGEYSMRGDACVRLGRPPTDAEFARIRLENEDAQRSAQ